MIWKLCVSFNAQIYLFLLFVGTSCVGPKFTAGPLPTDRGSYMTCWTNWWLEPRSWTSPPCVFTTSGLLRFSHLGCWFKLTALVCVADAVFPFSASLYLVKVLRGAPPANTKEALTADGAAASDVCWHPHSWTSFVFHLLTVGGCCDRNQNQTSQTRRVLETNLSCIFYIADSLIRLRSGIVSDYLL